MRALFPCHLESSDKLPVKPILGLLSLPVTDPEAERTLHSHTQRQQDVGQRGPFQSLLLSHTVPAPPSDASALGLKEAQNS